MNPTKQANIIIKGDGDRLTQVLINLLSNAIKFTHSGTITIKFDIRTSEIYHELQLSGKDGTNILFTILCFSATNQPTHVLF